MWVRATVDLGMTDEEFGRTTMRRLLAQLRRREEIEHRADLRAGVLASLLYNPHRKMGAKPMKPDDFFPGLDGKRGTPGGSVRAVNGKVKRSPAER